MSMRRRLRTLLLCGALQVGVLFGVPMRPGEIEETMQRLNGSKLAHLLPGEEDDGEPPPQG
jgi:hypothetical protein